MIPTFWREGTMSKHKATEIIISDDGQEAFADMMERSFGVKIIPDWDYIIWRTESAPPISNFPYIDGVMEIEYPLAKPPEG